MTKILGYTATNAMPTVLGIEFNGYSNHHRCLTMGSLYFEKFFQNLVQVI